MIYDGLILGNRPVMKENGSSAQGILQNEVESVIHKKTVLVVDDDLDTAISLGLLLKRMGYNVITVYDGKDGIRWVEDVYPDAVLLDLGMPGMDGFEVARTIRSTEWGATVQLIAVTGRGEMEDRAQTKAAGFDLHLVKPVNKWMLAEVLGPAERS